MQKRVFKYTSRCNRWRVDKIGEITWDERNTYFYLELSYPYGTEVAFRGNLSNPIFFKDNKDPLSFLNQKMNGKVIFTALDIDKCEIFDVLFQVKEDDSCNIFVLNLEDAYDTDERVGVVNTLVKKFTCNVIEDPLEDNKKCEKILRTYLFVEADDTQVASITIYDDRATLTIPNNEEMPDPIELDKVYVKDIKGDIEPGMSLTIAASSMGLVKYSIIRTDNTVNGYNLTAKSTVSDKTTIVIPFDTVKMEDPSIGCVEIFLK